MRRLSLKPPLRNVILARDGPNPVASSFNYSVSGAICALASTLHRTSTPAGAAWRRLTMTAIENAGSMDSEFEIRAAIH
jgi:hypothetical protein